MDFSEVKKALVAALAKTSGCTPFVLDFLSAMEHLDGYTLKFKRDLELKHRFATMSMTSGVVLDMALRVVGYPGPMDAGLVKLVATVRKGLGKYLTGLTPEQTDEFYLHEYRKFVQVKAERSRPREPPAPPLATSTVARHSGAPTLVHTITTSTAPMLPLAFQYQPAPATPPSHSTVSPLRVVPSTPPTGPRHIHAAGSPPVQAPRLSLSVAAESNLDAMYDHLIDSQDPADKHTFGHLVNARSIPVIPASTLRAVCDLLSVSFRTNLVTCFVFTHLVNPQKGGYYQCYMVILQRGLARGKSLAEICASLVAFQTKVPCRRLKLAAVARRLSKNKGAEKKKSSV